MRTRPLAALGVTALALGAAAPAAIAGGVGTTISFDGVGGLGVHSSFAHVEHLLGRPNTIYRSHGRVEALYYTTTGLVFSETTVRGISEYSIVATSSRYRLGSVHVGSSEAAGRRELRGADCDRTGCTGEDSHDRDRSLTITFRNGRVNAIGVYLFVDH